MTRYMTIETPFGDVRVDASCEPCDVCGVRLGSLCDQQFAPDGRLLCADCAESGQRSL